VCGIVASRRKSGTLDFLLTALRRLEYRGYDSAGVAICAGEGRLRVERSSGRVADLENRCGEASAWPQVQSPDGTEVGLGHTRWATHGGPTDENAHPHRDCRGRVAVVHNGIIENAEALRGDLLLAGHLLQTEVDTEVVAHLVEDELATGASLPAAMLTVRGALQGSWALAVLDATSGSLVVTASGSPLLIGSGAQGDHVASDAGALAGWVERITVLEDGDLVELGPEVRWWDAQGRGRAPRPLVPAQARAADVELCGHTDFMAKEIAEQPSMAARLVGRFMPGLDGSLWHELGLPEPRRLRFVACGTSLNASAAMARAFRELAGVSTELVIASEAETDDGHDDVLTVAVSQSGETADVLAALQRLRGPVLAITNNDRSSLARRADASVCCDAGTEVGVAATKTFTAQVLTGSAVALSLAAVGSHLPVAYWAAVRAFAEAPGRLEFVGAVAGSIAGAVAAEFVDAPGFLFLSRGSGVPYAAEGALKLKEITYRWAEALPAGELKHGPLALVTEGTPVVVVEAGDRARLASNISEVRARGGRVLRVAADDGATFPLVTDGPGAPWGPLESAVALQHLARALALELGRDADKPRNLAKSVTVQ
jgi:glucosamine--fructose-6-phosphate aminotransferase (isomerizing)